MRIGLVVTGGLHPSGREQVVPALVELVRRLSASHAVHAFALRHLDRPQQYRLGGAMIHDLGRPEGRWRQWRALASALDDAGPFDVLHAYWADPAGLLAALIALRRRIPCIVSCDSGEFVSLPDIEYGLQRHRRGRLAVALACRYATRVHVASRYMETRAHHVGVPTTCIPLGIDLGRFAPRPLERNRPPFRIVQVASLNHVKDQATLVDAIAIARRSVDIAADLVGEDTLRGQIQQRAAALGLSDAVTFHGFVSQDDLPALLGQADLYVQSSRHEAAGVAVLEAAAAGLPIVGTRVGYVSDWADDAAVAVRPADAEALASAIVAMLGDPPRRARFAAAARKQVQQYDAALTTARLTALYAAVARR